MQPASIGFSPHASFLIFNRIGRLARSVEQNLLVPIARRFVWTWTTEHAATTRQADHWKFPAILRGQAGHISRDATAIEAREKAVKKPQAPEAAKAPRKRGRPRKGEAREAPPETRLQMQGTRSLAENLADLPKACDWGTKRNSQGKRETWKGYKLHLDCIDGDIPVSAIVTSASLHDSQAAIPLAQMSARRVINLYDLMDGAYDAEPIRSFSRGLGHVPIIDANPRRGEKVEMDPATAHRYDERSTAERVNSALKDNYGGRFVRVRGEAKVKLHLMFGLIALCATQLRRWLE